MVNLMEYQSYLFLEMQGPMSKVITFFYIFLLSTLSLRISIFFLSVRSLASVAYRKSLDSRKQFYFDFFTVDVNEELSALHGRLLDRQVSFVQLCIKKILQIYKMKNKGQNSVVLIGHSMVNPFFFSLLSMIIFTNIFS